MNSIPATEWYRTYFGPDYLKIDVHTTTEKEVDFMIEALGMKNGGLHLDIGCGYGRHLIPLIERGYDTVIGSDLSKFMLDEAVRHIESGEGCESVAGARRVRERYELGGLFVRCDNRKLPFREVLDSACNMFNSFGYFAAEDDNYRMLTAVAEALKPDGLFLLDLTNRDFVVRLDDRHDWFEHGDAYILEHKWFDPIGNRSEIDVVVIDDEGARDYHHSIRLYSFTELCVLLEAAGFVVDDVYGGFGFEPFTVDRDRMLILARKRETEDV